MKTRTFLIKDLDCEAIVEFDTRKHLLENIEYYIDNLKYDWFDGSDTSYYIIYKDGTSENICEDYDGHKIRKQKILSIVENNPCTSVVYGAFEMNEYGVVTVSEDGITRISEENIEEIETK